MDQHIIKKISKRFEFEGDLYAMEELHAGNINNTFRLWTLGKNGVKQYTLQRINRYVFKNPFGIMENIQRVTQHLYRRLEELGLNPRRGVLRIINSCDGNPYVLDEDDGFWRAFEYLDNATAYNQLSQPELFVEIGSAFGNFQRLLADFPAECLHETIPGFHDTAQRYKTFEASVANDAAKRAQSVAAEIDFLRERCDMMGSIVNLINTDKLQLRVTHNDTKINNVLIDDKTKKAVCVIDLDTVMPGSSLYDFGDAVRFGACTAAEDEPDTDKISLDLELYRYFAKGFLSQVNGFLPEDEIALLPLGAKVLTCELAMRFLTDYLDGDVYFKNRYCGHNLVRARAQMKLLSDMENKYPEMMGIIEELAQ